MDDRQGAHLYRTNYLSQSGRVLSQSMVALVDGGPRPNGATQFARLPDSRQASVGAPTEAAPDIKP